MSASRFLVLAIAVAAGAACDVSRAEGLRLSGFGTLGVTQASGSQGEGFRREIVQPALQGDTRADVDSRLGLQANWQVDPQWEFVGQVLLKRRAGAAPLEESIAWGFAAYSFSPEWTLRIGRTSPDLFLLADYRNVGFAYPWMRPSVEFYGWMPVSAMDGADLSRNWAEGDTNWRAKLFAGRTSLTLAYTGGDTRVVGRLVGGTLSRENDGLTLKASLAIAKTRPGDLGPLQAFRGQLAQVTQLPVPSVAAEAQSLLDTIPGEEFDVTYGALGGTWERDAWTLQAEVARISGNFAASNSWYAYASAAYRIGSVTVFGLVGGVRPVHPASPVPQWQATLTPVIGPMAAAGVQMLGTTAAQQNNGSREDQHTVSVGLRWDLAANAALKLQWDHVHIAPDGSGLWYGPSLAARNADVLSAGVDFVF